MDMTEKEAKIILALASNNMNVLQTARSTFYHPNTVRYYIRVMTKTYNLNPTKFYDLLKLVKLAEDVLQDTHRYTVCSTVEVVAKTEAEAKEQITGLLDGAQINILGIKAIRDT